MKKRTRLLTAMALMAGAFSNIQAADLYVSLANGANGNEGTKEAPLKNLWKAL